VCVVMCVCACVCRETVSRHCLTLLSISGCQRKQCVAVCCSVCCKCVAVCCSVLQLSERAAVCIAMLSVRITPVQCYAMYVTLQHTATHCNTLQHTATHCNTLQRNATHCASPMMYVTLQYVTHCNTLQHTATNCNTLSYDVCHTTVCNSALQCDAVCCRVLQVVAVDSPCVNSARSSPGLLLWGCQHAAAHGNTMQHTATHCNTHIHLSRRLGVRRWSLPVCAVWLHVRARRLPVCAVWRRVRAWRLPVWPVMSRWGG